MSEQPDTTDGVAAMRTMRSQRTPRQTPPSRNPRPPAAEDTSPPAETSAPSPAAAKHQQPDYDNPTRVRNRAVKRVQDAANSWAAQHVKLAERTSELANVAQDARDAGVERDRLTTAVQSAADRHGLDPTALLSRELAYELGFRRRR